MQGRHSGSTGFGFSLEAPNPTSQLYQPITKQLPLEPADRICIKTVLTDQHFLLLPVLHYMANLTRLSQCLRLGKADCRGTITKHSGRPGVWRWVSFEFIWRECAKPSLKKLASAKPRLAEFSGYTSPVQGIHQNCSLYQSHVPAGYESVQSHAKHLILYSTPKFGLLVPSLKTYSFNGLM